MKHLKNDLTYWGFRATKDEPVLQVVYANEVINATWTFPPKEWNLFFKYFMQMKWSMQLALSCQRNETCSSSSLCKLITWRTIWPTKVFAAEKR